MPPGGGPPGLGGPMPPGGGPPGLGGAMPPGGGPPGLGGAMPLGGGPPGLGGAMPLGGGPLGRDGAPLDDLKGLRNDSAREGGPGIDLCGPGELLLKNGSVTPVKGDEFLRSLLGISGRRFLDKISELVFLSYFSLAPLQIV